MINFFQKLKPKLFPFFFLLSILSLVLIGVILCHRVFSWSTPFATPPGGTLPTFLDVSFANQAKSGSLSINTSTIHTFPLDVAGVIRIGRFSASPSGAVGALYYDTTSNKFKGYQGSSWQDLGGGLWTLSGNNIYYTTGNVGIGTSTPSAALVIQTSVIPHNTIVICRGGVCCPIWKDCDGDGKTYGNGDCDESCSTCYVGSTAYTTSPDGKDQDCDGIVDDADGTICTPSYSSSSYEYGYHMNDHASICSNWVKDGFLSNTNSSSNSPPADTTHCVESGGTCTSYVGGWGQCTQYSTQYCQGTHYGCDIGAQDYTYEWFNSSQQPCEKWETPSTFYYWYCKDMTGCSSQPKYR